ncbi:sensor histidine kinase [Sphingobacterium pedocola]|uniref:histidine kinase n=1 Tax=Sphingobacterium pedocola TaxID=2082722 RepID=A0ABR9TAR4_9SPHI|nr:HAMP domain-containing sensor histidine kinase [Sphingobacterium pedocola]MBE8721762.1 sensor histidine kinase [Sphingobacterium pedocola]
MKKRSIALIIWLMSIALLGVVAMQYYFIRETYQQKSKLFDEGVMASLNAVSGLIERREIYLFTREQQKMNQTKYLQDQEKQRKKERLLSEQLDVQEKIKLLQQKQIEIENRFRDAERELKDEYGNAVELENSFYETYIRRPAYQRYVDIQISQGPSRDGNFINNDVSIVATVNVPIIAAKDDSVRYGIPIIDGTTGKAKLYTIVLPPKSSDKIAFELYNYERKLKELNLRKLESAFSLEDSVAILGGKNPELVEQVAIAMELAKKPLRERINITSVQRLIKDELNRRDIHTPFNIEIRDRHNNNLIFNIQTAANFNSSEKITRYSTPLFQGDANNQTPGLLSVYFPNKKSIIADNMSYLILPTLALFALLIGCFVYTLSIIFKQKKISEMKTDFINNMTHEFKTPVATIMIASESLRDPEISSDEKRVNRLANIIYDENVRLGSHIERVLNIARLEKENLKIERVDVEVNDLVSGVLDSMQLQLQKANGRINIDLSAEKDTVIGDELHLSNVMFNLVDNAIKYSLDAPEITVKTYNSKGNIIFTVADKGMGMTKEQQEKIFDQFYRIPTGNIHNVKGFGLGLSYVNDIIKRLDGRIEVKSEKDKGTQFEVTLPLKSN